ncbi:MAG: acetate kinase [Bacilli bacterium]|nr:acetate kinase [Bacilli bacterium]
MKILSVNAGSSSLKFQVYEMPEQKVLINGYIEKIGEEDSFWTIKINGEKIKNARHLKNHEEAVEVLKEELINHGIVKELTEISGVGHRVLHGGEKYSEPTVIDEKVIKDIEDLTKLGPLHHPGNLAGIRAMMEALPNVKHVAVFDTAFHQSMPKRNFLYPVPYEWYEKLGVRKYGFHGTSHQYITTVMQEELNKKDVNLIICHIGSGASVACVKNGKGYDTTMGITPLDGLMMGTRSGAIDPSIIKYVMDETGKSIDEITNDLNKKSGFFGIAGAADCRDVENMAAEGNERAVLALEMYADRIAKYIADYYIELEGKVDAIIFTAGVFENGPERRHDVMERLAPLGVKIDEQANYDVASYRKNRSGIVSAADSSIRCEVVPTDEELMIAKDAYEFVK